MTHTLGLNFSVLSYNQPALLLNFQVYRVVVTVVKEQDIFPGITICMICQYTVDNTRNVLAGEVQFGSHFIAVAHPESWMLPAKLNAIFGEPEESVVFRFPAPLQLIDIIGRPVGVVVPPF
jgi:hypothetical protein